jgi:DNA-directed RNA polymerase specialized sigma24 family protein
MTFWSRLGTGCVALHIPHHCGRTTVTISVRNVPSLLRALGNWDAAQYLWRRHRVLKKPRLPMTQTIRERTLNRNPPPRATFDESIWQYRRRLLCMARRILRDEADAEDAVQEAYVSALSHSDHFEGRSSPLTWITKILINQASSQLRDKIRQPLAVAVGFDEVESLVSVADENRPMKDTSKPGQRKIGQDISAPVARTGNHMKARRHGTKPYAFLSTRQALA